MVGKYPLILGDSHAVHLAFSLGAINGTIEPEFAGLALDVLDDGQKRGEFILSDHRRSVFLLNNEMCFLDPNVESLLLSRSSLYEFCILSLGNFFHNDFFIKRDPAFDFSDPTVPHFLQGAQIISREVIVNHFRTRMTPFVYQILAIKKLLKDLEIFYIGCPPPGSLVGSN